MDSFFSNKSGRVVIVDPAASRRLMIADVIKSLGFMNVDTLGGGKELLSYLETENVDWVILPLMANEKINAINLLKTFTIYPKFRSIRVSLFLSENEHLHIPFAFELGLLSWHEASYIREELETKMHEFFQRFEALKWNPILMSADYLRDYLLERRQYRHVLALEQSLLEFFPGAAQLVLRVAEAQLLDGQLEKGRRTLLQVELLDPTLSSEIDHLRRKFSTEEPSEIDVLLGSLGEEATPSKEAVNALGVASCVIIDPDSTVQYSMTELLKAAGVPNVQAFSDGGTAWRWIKDNPEPGLIIQEWRIPEMPGPILLQRIRNHGFVNVPIIVASSLVKKADIPIVTEMGVSVVLEKPIDQAAFFRTVVDCLQQAIHPTEQASLERRIRSLLESGSTEEASRLWLQYKNDTRISSAAKQYIEAEFLYHAQQYEKARDLAVESLKYLGNSLMLVNLLGKCLLQTGQTQASLKCFERAQSFSPLNIERLCKISEIEQDLGNSAKSIQHVDLASILDGGSELVLATDANLSLQRGDAKRASHILAQLDSFVRMLSMMNNRAIAVIRSGFFDEGIELYKRTLAALPDPWSRIHDAVLFNLGLALARYGDLPQAIEFLSKMRCEGNLPLQKKRDSLFQRVAYANVSGKALHISEVSQPMPKANDGLQSDEAIIMSLEIKRGEQCCYLVFRANELLAPESITLLGQLPSFMERDAFHRDAAFNSMSNAS